VITPCSQAARPLHRARIVACFIAIAVLWSAAPASAAEQIYFAATDNITNVLVQKINAETQRIDISTWYLSEHSISIALANRFHAGVPVRLIGDRGAIFEISQATRQEFYWLANQGIPIRLRYNPTWYPEIDHWKATIFAGQNLVSFGSANYTPFELAPVSPTNYKDELVLFSDDPALVGAFKTKFDKYWNDTTPEPESLISNPPYFKNWNDACALESACADYHTQYPNPAPMIIDTTRLELDNPLPPEMNWGQGFGFNSRLAQSITDESTAIDFVIYRLTVDNITNALLAKHAAGVPIRIILEENEYLNRKWPEFWITHANVDTLWAAGIPIKKRIHDGLTHMKTIVTSSVATIASSNYTAAWQRDHNYFVPAAQKPTIYQAIKNRFQTMWTDPAGFADFVPQPPDAPSQLAPPSGSVGVSTTPTLTWPPAPFASNFDVYLGTSPSAMTVVGNVLAQLTNNPPDYTWTPSSALQPGTTYYWKIVSRTNATPLMPSLVAPSAIWSFTTAGTPGPPAPPFSPSPSDGATGVGLTPTLSWAPGAVGTTFNVAFGTANPPPTVATGLTSPSYPAGSLTASTTYFWRVTAVSIGGSTAGPLWSFTTGSGGGSLTDVVIYGSDVTTLAGTWSHANDATAAAGVKLTTPDAGAPTVEPLLANPSNYFEATFQGQAGTRYRVWLRIHAINDSKFNDSVFVQFSDGVTSSGNPIYRIGTTSGYNVNLWTCSTCQSFGWGWQRNAYWLSDTGDIWFQNTGQHTIRVQVREDGVEIDQIVISPTTYATNPPGPVSNDNTIVPKPGGGGPPPPGAPGSPNPANGATGVSTTAILSWSAANATSYDVSFGTANPPPQVLTGTTSTSYSPSNLVADTTYFWQVVARNSGGATAGPVWSFHTAIVPPAMPNSPSPANGATNVSTSTALTWSSAGATSFDVLLDTTDPPSQVASGLTNASYAPSGLAPGTIYFWQIVAHNSSGAVQGPTWSFTTAAAPPPPINEIVIYASDIPPAALQGSWSLQSDGTSPNGTKLGTPDNGVANASAPLASPVHFFDVTFNADAGRTYTIWLRIKALNNSKFNDAVWVQFANATVNGSPIYPIGTTSGLLVNLATDSSAVSLSGWGWANGAYWLSQPATVVFPSGGQQTLRMQIREDGVQIDQIVLSHTNYFNTAPGPPTNDSTIVPKP